MQERSHAGAISCRRATSPTAVCCSRSGSSIPTGLRFPSPRPLDGRLPGSRTGKRASVAPPIRPMRSGAAPTCARARTARLGSSGRADARHSRRAPRAAAAHAWPQSPSVLSAPNCGPGGGAAAPLDADHLEDPARRRPDCPPSSPPRRPHHPQDRPEPLVELQLDCKAVVQVAPLVSAKQAHAVEVFDAVEVGTSLWLMGEPRASSTAATVFGPLRTRLERIGLPARVRFDRDPRFLGRTSRRDFPTPFLRFW
jgi:hypothetical protein